MRSENSAINSKFKLLKSEGLNIVADFCSEDVSYH